MIKDINGAEHRGFDAPLRDANKTSLRSTEQTVRKRHEHILVFVPFPYGGNYA